MRTLKRNQIPFYYSLYEDNEQLTDEQGYFSGEEKIIYSEPVKCMANISPAKGEAYADVFGTNIQYDKVICIDNSVMNTTHIDENTILFVDIEPTKNADDEYTPDYNVKKVAKSLNNTLIAISKVKVS